MSRETHIDITNRPAGWVVAKVNEARDMERDCYLYMPNNRPVRVSIDEAGAVWIGGRNIAWNPQLTSEQVLKAYEAALSPQLQLL